MGLISNEAVIFQTPKSKNHLTSGRKKATNILQNLMNPIEVRVQLKVKNNHAINVNG